MILIQEKKNLFIPIFHINYIYKNSSILGSYNLKDVNLNAISYNFFKTHKLNIKILDLTQNRDEAIINLIIIHSNNCKFENINSYRKYY